LLSALLVIGMLARGHTFQALGVPFGCAHAGEVELSEASQSDGSHDDHGCPPDCHRCACGQIPMMLPAGAELRYLLLPPFLIEIPAPADGPGHLIHQRLDRPPRPLRV